MGPAIGAATGLLFAALGVTAPGTAMAEADLATATSVVEAHKAIPTFDPPGAPFDAKTCMAGKKILSIPVTSAIPFVAGIEEALVEAGKEVGVEVKTWQNQGNPTQWVQGVEYAVSNGYDAVGMTAGIIPSSLGPQLTAAREAGLRIYATHHADVTDAPDPMADLNLPISYTEVGQIMAAWVIEQTGGAANVLVIGSDDVLPSQPYWKSFQAELTKLDPDSKATYYNVTVPEWATKIQTTTQSALLSDPSINYIMPLYDSMSQFILPALAITGKRGQVPIASFNGTPFVIDLVQNGDVAMDLGESLGWIARSTLDAYMRDLCGLDDAPDELYVPFLIFDKDNAETAGTPADFDQGYGDAHVEGFRKLWGLE
ncbi:ABC-type sugar transport system, periplasmic component [Marinibacterium anthonyi]|nr:ABC-type sugar transport system, periplasmic component [Marinibacterium anthonyi]